MYYAITNNIFKITLKLFTTSEDSGQPGQMLSLIKVFLAGASSFKGTFALSALKLLSCGIAAMLQAFVIVHDSKQQRRDCIHFVKTQCVLGDGWGGERERFLYLYGNE